MVKRSLLVIPLIFGFGLAQAIAQDEDMTVDTADDPELGTILTDAEGMTLYLFEEDEEGVSNCYDECAENWPPLTADEAPMAPEGVPGEFDLIERDDGEMQVAYDGMALYYFIGDEAAGDTTGEGVGDVWFVISVDDVDATPDPMNDVDATPDPLDATPEVATPDPDDDVMDPDATPPGLDDDDDNDYDDNDNDNDYDDDNDNDDDGGY